MINKNLRDSLARSIFSRNSKFSFIRRGLRIPKMADPRLRQIFIKTGVVKRFAKEKVSYEKEAEQEQRRIEKFRRENRDEHDIRKQEEVIQENLMMIPECQRK